MGKREEQKAKLILFTNSKELNETSIWLRIIGRSGMLREALIAQLVRENNELCKILTASLKTARARPTK